MNPRVSIIMTTYNPPRYLRQAINSVISQSFTEWELIIVNDCSPYAATEQIILECSDPRIQYVKNDENIGNGKSANIGIAQSRGEFIARLDDDDEWVSPDKLAKQVAFLDANLDHVAVGSNILVADYDTDTTEYRNNYRLTNDEIKSHFYSASPLAHSAVLMRRAAINIEQAYDSSLRRIEDYDLWLRIGRKGKLANLPEYLVKWRSPSKTLKRISKLRLSDHCVKLQVLWRHRGHYPNFWLPFSTELLKTFPYALVAFFSGMNSR